MTAPSRFRDTPPTLDEFIENLRAALDSQGVRREDQGRLLLDSIEFHPRLAPRVGVKLLPDAAGGQRVVISNERYVR